MHETDHGRWLRDDYSNGRTQQRDTLWLPFREKKGKEASALVTGESYRICWPSLGGRARERGEITQVLARVISSAACAASWEGGGLRAIVMESGKDSCLKRPPHEIAGVSGSLSIGDSLHVAAGSRDARRCRRRRRCCLGISEEEDRRVSAGTCVVGEGTMVLVVRRCKQ